MIKQQLGEPLEGEYPPEFIERYPELRRASGRTDGTRHSFTYILVITSPLSSFAGTSAPAITWPKTVYWPSRSGRFASVT